MLVVVSRLKTNGFSKRGKKPKLILIIVRNVTLLFSVIGVLATEREEVALFLSMFCVIK